MPWEHLFQESVKLVAPLLSWGLLGSGESRLPSLSDATRSWARWPGRSQHLLLWYFSRERLVPERRGW